MKGEEESRADLDQYTENTDPSELQSWTDLAKRCQEARLLSPDAMDIYDIDPGQAGATRTQSQLELVLAEGENGTGRGETTWLAQGLKLHDAQYDHLILKNCASLPHLPTD